MKRNQYIELVLVVLGLIVFSLTVVSPAFAGRRIPYACNSDICSPEREEYRKRAMGMACSAERRLNRLITRLDRKKRDLQDTEQQLRTCLLNPRRNLLGCPFLYRRVLGLTVVIRLIQAQINAMVRQISASCDSSFPVPGRRRNPTQCEQTEASKYCPVATVAQALLSVSQRCTDLRIEAGNALLNCNPGCIAPPNLALVMDSDPQTAALIAELPECEIPQSPTAVPSTTPTINPTVVSTVAPTIVPTVAPTANVIPQQTPHPTPIATVITEN